MCWSFSVLDPAEKGRAAAAAAAAAAATAASVLGCFASVGTNVYSSGRRSPCCFSPLTPTHWVLIHKSSSWCSSGFIRSWSRCSLQKSPGKTSSSRLPLQSSQNTSQQARVSKNASRHDILQRQGVYSTHSEMQHLAWRARCCENIAYPPCCHPLPQVVEPLPVPEERCKGVISREQGLRTQAQKPLQDSRKRLRERNCARS